MPFQIYFRRGAAILFSYLNHHFIVLKEPGGDRRVIAGNDRFTRGLITMRFNPIAQLVNPPGEIPLIELSGETNDRHGSG